jgi:Tol biopolymer transport system component
MRGGGLFAVPFDLDTLEASPPAAMVQPEVWTDSVWAVARYDVSPDGTLVYAPGGDFARTIPTWIERDGGREQALPLPADIYNTFNLSPDGTKLAIQVGSGVQDQIYIYDSVRGSFSRSTLEGSNTYPVWSHDGRTIYFSSNRDGRYRLYRKPVDGSGPAERVLSDEQERVMEVELQWPISVTPDGAWLLIMTWGHPGRGGDSWVVALDGSEDPKPLLATESNEIIPMISPDGRWVAYLSDKTGPYEINVRPFPDVGQREWQVSDGGGFDARWSPQGDELLYRTGWSGLMSVSVSSGPDLAPGVPRQVIDTDFHDAAGASFDLSRDGRRILVNKPVDLSLTEPTALKLVGGWSEELRRLAPLR